jgi:hypothetical protein
MALQSYSLRKRLRQKEGEPDVYIYDELSDFLRHQIAAAFDQGIGYFFQSRGYESVPDNANSIWHELDQICRTEIWPYAQSANGHETPNKRFLNFLLNDHDIDEVLGAIEFGAKFLGYVDRLRERSRPENRGANKTGKAALEDINRRFIEHGVGYQVESYEIIRIDSKLVHAEIIKPAIALLAAPMFAKANEDFMIAHRHYRAREYKDCVTSANRAFESALKAICDTGHWKYAPGDNASQLITKVNENGLFTRDFDQSFTAYIAMMKSGIPAVRNKSGGHGESVADARVTGEIARYALNLSATNILFVAECYRAMKGEGS